MKRRIKSDKNEIKIINKREKRDKKKKKRK